MISDCSYSGFRGLIRRIFPLVLLLAAAVTANGACSITSGNYTGQVGVAVVYQITVANGNPTSYNATNLPPGVTVDTSTGAISGTPTTAGTYAVTLSATYNGGCGTITKPVTFTITAPSFVGFRLPDFPLGAGAPSNPRLTLQLGANGTTTIGNRFSATLEIDAGGGTWVPYNHFVGVNDPASWITDAPLPVRQSLSSTGTPRAFASSQLTTEVPAPGAYMKADPRATRFGIFQMDTNPTTNSRIVLSLWPSNDSNAHNGFGGTVGTSFPGPVEHSPNRFSAGTTYYPATFAINGPVDARHDATTIYTDNDGVTRPADGIYANTTYSGYGSSTPYNTTVYRPIMLNRPFRNVAELGYVFRDLPWKTLDFFTEKSADAGLLDIFTINDGGPGVGIGGLNITSMVQPTVVAGSVNLNTTQPADLQPVLAGSILDEINTTTVNKTGTGATDAPILAAKIVNATNPTVNPAAIPIQNKAELLTRAGLPTTILPTAANDKQSVKAQREVVTRAMSSVSQTRVWNVLIDVVAQSGHYKPNAASLQNDFIVEGEQHYWVHVSIDRFTGQVIDKQIEVVNE